MNYNQYGGREINQAKLDLLKKNTSQGRIMVVDTSGLLYRANPSGQELLSFSKRTAMQANQIHFYRALRKCIEDGTIDMYITTGVMEELDQESGRAKSHERRIAGLAPAIDGLIDTLTAKERVFYPGYLDYPFYTEALAFVDKDVLDFIEETIQNCPRVKNAEITAADAGITVALLYASQSKDKERVFGIFRDEDIRYLERTFLRVYPGLLPRFLTRNNGSITSGSKIRDMNFLEPLEGQPFLRRMPIKRIVLPGEKPNAVSSLDAACERYYICESSQGREGIEIQVTESSSMSFPSSTSNA